MREASWLLLGSCLGSRRASLWRQKYHLLSLHSCHITSFIPDSRAQGSTWIANYWLLASFQLIWPQCKDVRCRFMLWDGAVELLWVRRISRSVREELMYDRWKAGMLWDSKIALYSCFPQQYMNTLLQMMDKIHPRVYQANYLTKRWLYQKKKIIPVYIIIVSINVLNQLFIFIF